MKKQSTIVPENESVLPRSFFLLRSRGTGNFCPDHGESRQSFSVDVQKSAPIPAKQAIFGRGIATAQQRRA